MSNNNYNHPSFIRTLGFGSNTTINTIDSSNMMTSTDLEEQRLYGHQQVGTPSAGFERTPFYQQRLYQTQDEVTRQFQSLNVNAPQPPPHGPPTLHTTHYSRPPITSPIQNRPFSPASSAFSGSTASLNSLPQVYKDENNPFLLAGLRIGESLILVTPKRDKRFVVNEKMLKETCGIGLGDFMKANVVGESELVNFNKIDTSKFPAFKFKTKVEGDIVQINSLKGRIESSTNGQMVFNSKHFSDGLVVPTNEMIHPGDYFVTITLKLVPQKIGDVTYHFDVSNLSPYVRRNTTAVPIVSAPVVRPGPQLFLFAATRIYKEGQAFIHLIALNNSYEHYELESTLTRQGVQLGNFVHAERGSDGHLQNYRKTNHTANLKVTVDKDMAYIENVRAELVMDQGDRLFKSKIASNVWCRRNDLNIGQQYTIRIRGLYGPALLQNGKTARLEGIVTGGTAIITPREAEPPKPIGKGFSEVSQTQTIKNEHEPKKPQHETLRAVVLSSIRNKHGVHTHFLWVFEKLEEGYFTHRDQHSKGHVFKGTYERRANGDLGCVEYLQPDESIHVQGAIDTSKKVFFVVTVIEDNGSYKADNFGEIIDSGRLLEGLNANRQLVKIQRRTRNHWAIISLV